MIQKSSKRPQCRRPKGASSTSGAGTPGRPLSKMRTIGETAELLGTSTRTIRRFIKSRQLPKHRFGRLVRLSDADIVTFLALHRDI